MEKVCQFCGNRNFNNVSVAYTYKHNDQHLLIKNVPCEQCEFCGGQYFYTKILKKIGGEFNEIDLKGKKTLLENRVPIQNFSDIRKAS